MAKTLSSTAVSTQTLVPSFMTPGSALCSGLRTPPPTLPDACHMIADASAEAHGLVCVCVLQLVEAKLKRAYQEGQAARLAGQDPLAAELAALMPRPKTHAAAPPLPIGPEDDHHTPADPSPSPQSPAGAAVDVSLQQGCDAGGVGGGLSREEQLSVAQADANMAALLQEEAGSAHLATLLWHCCMVLCVTSPTLAAAAFLRCCMVLCVTSSNVAASSFRHGCIVCSCHMTALAASWVLCENPCPLWVAAVCNTKVSVCSAWCVHIYTCAYMS